MSKPKCGISAKGKKMHYSVGAVIRFDDDFLLIDRAKFPFGFAGVAGHVDENELPEDALVREVFEESGLTVVDFKLIFEEEIDWNKCSKRIEVHYWFLYECKVEGTIKGDLHETKSIGIYNVDELKKLKLEPVWEYWLKKLGVLS